MDVQRVAQQDKIYREGIRGPVAVVQGNHHVVGVVQNAVNEVPICTEPVLHSHCFAPCKEKAVS